MSTSNPNVHLHVVHRITAGNQHANTLPPSPEGRPLVRVWTVIDADKLREMGPVHNVSAFMEDRMHDWRVVDNDMRYYSRITPTDAAVDIVLDYETNEERKARLSANNFHPITGLPVPGKRPAP